MADVILHDHPAFRERYYEIRREGLPVIYLIPKKRATFYAVLRVEIGSYDRAYRDGEKIRPILRGTAHFLEHKLFANPDGSDAMERLRDLGADANAYTTGTSTCYLFNCRESFGESLKELLTFVSQPYFTRENVEIEKKIILQEAAMYGDSPSSRLFIASIRRLYRDHPIRDEIVGTPNAIGAITPSRLYDVYSAFYHTGNMQLFVAGDLTPEDVVAPLQDVSMPSRDGEFRVSPAAEAGRVYKSVKTLRRRVSKPLFNVTAAFPERDEDREERQRRMLAMGIVNACLFSDSGSLYGELKDKGLLTNPLRWMTEWNPGVCFFSVSGESASPRKVFALIRERMRELIERGIGDEDFSRLCRAHYAETVSSFDDAEELVDAFCDSMPDWADPYEEASLFGTLTADYVNGVLRELYSPDRLNLTVVTADKENQTETEDEE